MVGYCRTAARHRDSESSEKGYGEDGGKSIGHGYGRVPRRLPKPNERDRKRHDRQRKRNNHNRAENSEYILARYKLGSHGLSPFLRRNEFARTLHAP